MVLYLEYVFNSHIFHLETSVWAGSCIIFAVRVNRSSFLEIPND